MITMNKYSIWKYVLIGLVLGLGFLYTLPNFYGEAPAVQVSSAKSTLKLSPGLAQDLAGHLREQGVSPDGVFYEQTLGEAPSSCAFALPTPNSKPKTCCVNV